MKELDKNQIIWRYMSLDKFIDLLLNKRLIFSPIKIMSDQNEVRWILDTIDESKENHREGVEKFVESHLKNNFISCWTKNPDEKISLWRHYLGKDGIGVAIKSKVDSFYKHIKWEENSFSIQEVVYKKELKFEDIEGGQLNFTKGIAYKDEEELRIFTHFNFMKFDEKRKQPVFFEPPSIMSIGIDLENFIDSIMISPFCATWQIEVIKQLTEEIVPSLSEKFVKSMIKEKN
tara:strand:+ start:768 stop:1463 length:696 start_codon:yes stop_codon:yes gene_type:complete